MSTDEVIEMASSTSTELPPMDAAIAILAGDHSVLSWNQRAEGLTGYTIEALAGADWLATFEPPELMQQLLLRVHAGEFPMHARVHLRTADGRRLPVDVQCAPLRTAEGRATQILLVIRQVAPSHAWQPHDARLPLMGRLAGSVSHEIRNPMNAIFLHTDLVEEEVRQPTPGDPTQVMQSLATIKAEVTRLHALIQDFLFLARLSDLQRVPVDLQALVEDLVYEMHPQCVVRGVTLTQSGLADLGEVALHQALFRRALLNIFQLLIEAMPQSTTLILGGARADCHVQLQIHDPERVIPSEVWAELQMSLQAETMDAADLRRYVAQEIITAHGGKITVSHAPQAGMQCTITLPLGTTA
jgi:PAS domain S-box-containing protein